MNLVARIAWTLAAAAFFIGCAQTTPSPGARAAGDEWMDRFPVSKADLKSTGRGTYFILEPGFQMTYEGESDEGDRLVVTVLPETKMIDGVETRIVEERESAMGHLTEVSRNYFAIDHRNGDVYYFGEDVDTYKNDKINGHPGSWHSGENGAHFGLMMPGTARVGQKFYQELSPKTAMDRVEIVSTSEIVKTPAGEFKNCVKTKETTPLERGTVEHKLYAPGVGLIVDGELKLAKYGGQ